MQMKSINRLALAGVLAGVLVQGRAETLNGDITAAVREADLTPVVTAPKPKGTTPTGGDGTLLFDGVLQRSDEGHPYPTDGQRYYIETSKLPVTITYDVPDGFVSGKSGGRQIDHVRRRNGQLRGDKAFRRHWEFGQGETAVRVDGRGFE